MLTNTPAHLPLLAESPDDFDFFIGAWVVQHRRLKQRLVGSQEWELFAGRNVCHKILGGYGNVDDNLLELPEGTYRAVTLRAFDPTTRSWSIWWLDGRAAGVLDVPVVGTFANGVGTFIAKDTFKGQPIMVRFTWLNEVADHPRWEQAFSPDGGESWETNWIMEFARL
jgi:hypothetical protein